MPSKKKKYNARFPAGRIKKIMQTDEEVGKVAQAVPVIISKALEMFVESLLKKSSQITQSRNAKTLTPSHMKQCILSESRFDFLKDLVKNIPDASVQEDNENNALVESNIDFGVIKEEPGTPVEPRPPPKEKRKNLYGASSAGPCVLQETVSRDTSTSRTPVIQFVPNLSRPENSKFNFSVDNLLKNTPQEESKLHVTIASQEVNMRSTTSTSQRNTPRSESASEVSSFATSSTGGNLCIDEDYDN